MLSRSRTRILEALESHASPLNAASLAGELGLHVNTARFHLEALVDAGLAERVSEPTGHPGRPRIVYSASPDAPQVGQRSYQLLAEILAGHMAAHSRNPSQTAERAGYEWGRFLASRPEPFTRTTPERAIGELLSVLDDAGFAPAAVGSGRHRKILLNHCPFREIAVRHRDVVCGLHLGLARGLLEGIAAPVTADRIEPFLTPTQCAITIKPGR